MINDIVTTHGDSKVRIGLIDRAGFCNISLSTPYLKN